MPEQTDLAPSWYWTERDEPELTDEQEDELSLIQSVENMARHEWIMEHPEEATLTKWDCK